jgi:GNAT superfamily N-acetyltransferase
MNLDDYLKNPCGTLSIPYWKTKKLQILSNIEIFHRNCFEDGKNYDHVDIYFRLINDLAVLPENNDLVKTINVENDINDLVNLINLSYQAEHIKVTQDDINRWMKHPVYDHTLWVKINIDNHMIASGIAEFDKETKEGIIEWVQVHPNFQRKGYGKMIVNELVYRLSKMAKFITVSGNMNNLTQPEKLYRSCGFSGDDVWYICYLKNVR